MALGQDKLADYEMCNEGGILCGSHVQQLIGPGASGLRHKEGQVAHLLGLLGQSVSRSPQRTLPRNK